MQSNLELSIDVIAALAVVLVATAVFGRLARYVNQPRVVGEILAGILLGPTLLGTVAPGVQEHLFTPEVKGVLYSFSIIGLTFFMFLVGAGIDHTFVDGATVRRSVKLAVAGLVPAFALGGLVAIAFKGDLGKPGVSDAVFVLFLGGALSITAFPVLSRIMHERDVANTRFGSLTLMAASIDDAVAWFLLALITALVTAGNGWDALPTLAGTVVFAALMLTAGKRLLDVLARKVERAGTVTHDVMAAVIAIVLVAGWVTEVIGVFSVFGGFITGMAMPHSPAFRRELQHRLNDLVTILVVPIFFVLSGLNTQLRVLTEISLLPMVAVVLVAYAGKYVGCALYARHLGYSWRHSSAIGGLMNARGLMELVFINVGLAYGVITQQMFSTLVVVALLTTATTLPIYRASVTPEMEDEARRERAAVPAPVPLRPVPAAHEDLAAAS